MFYLIAREYDRGTVTVKYESACKSFFYLSLKSEYLLHAINRADVWLTSKFIAGNLAGDNCDVKHILFLISSVVDFFVLTKACAILKLSPQSLQIVNHMYLNCGNNQHCSKSKV